MISTKVKRQKGRAVNVLLNWHLRIFVENKISTNCQHMHSRNRRPGSSQMPRPPPSICLSASVHAVPSAGTSPLLLASVHPHDPAWVSPRLSSTPRALPLQGLLRFISAPIRACHTDLPLFLYCLLHQDSCRCGFCSLHSSQHGRHSKSTC